MTSQTTRQRAYDYKVAARASFVVATMLSVVGVICIIAVPSRPHADLLSHGTTLLIISPVFLVLATRARILHKRILENYTLEQ